MNTYLFYGASLPSNLAVFLHENHIRKNISLVADEEIDCLLCRMFASLKQRRKCFKVASLTASVVCIDYPYYVIAPFRQRAFNSPRWLS